ncbi:UNVERIFIED_CONTAM: hypothetical protein K2H54_050585 [Gekko kuhli]
MQSSMSGHPAALPTRPASACTVCKACKKQSSLGDQCQAAMLRKWCHLQKVNQVFKALKHCTATSPGQCLPKVEILRSAICHIESLQHLLRHHCCHPPMPSGSEPASPDGSAGATVSPTGGGGGWAAGRGTGAGEKVGLFDSRVAGKVANIKV